MARQSEDKDARQGARGRDYDRVSKDGSSAAGTLGTGGTGDIDREWTAKQPGNRQRGEAQRQGRTDDLLSTDTGDAQRGFTPSKEAGELQTGLGGIESLSTGHAGNRQSEGERRPDEK